MWGVLRRNPFGTIIALALHVGVIVFMFVGISDKGITTSSNSNVNVIMARVVNTRKIDSSIKQAKSPTGSQPKAKNVGAAHLANIKSSQHDNNKTTPASVEFTDHPQQDAPTTKPEQNVVIQEEQIAAKIAADEHSKNDSTRLPVERQRETTAKMAEEQQRREAAVMIVLEQKQREAAAKIAEEQQQREAAAKIAEEQLHREAAAKIAEEQLHREAATKIAKEQQQREAAAKIAEEQQQREAAAKIAEEQQQRETAAKIAEGQRHEVAAKKNKVKQTGANYTNSPKITRKKTESTHTATTDQHDDENIHVVSNANTIDADHSQDTLWQKQYYINRDELREVHSEIKKAIYRTWRIPPYSSDLRCTLNVRISEDGDVLAVRILKSSGSQSFDASAERAVKRASPLPVPKNRNLFDENLKLDFDPTAY